MPTATINDLRDALGLGLGIVTRVWDFKVRDWVTSVSAADIDNDGEVEVIACSRDGRVHLLTAEKGECRWERIVGEKAWVGTGIVSDLSIGGTDATGRIIAGTRDGKVYCIDKDGRTITRDGEALPFDNEGWAINEEAEKEACWFNTSYVIRQVAFDPLQLSQIILGSDDRCAYGLDYQTGKQIWQFPTSGRVRTVCSHDINGDGQAEILVGSTDNYLYLLDQQGHLIDKHSMNYPIRTVFVSDIDQDGNVEILVTTDGKDLVALVYLEDMETASDRFVQKWRRLFDNRLLALCATDIDNDTHAEIIASSEDKHTYILDGEGNIVWRHDHKYRVLSIYPYDIDNDGLPELLVGSDNNIVRAMRVRLRRGLGKKILKLYRQLGTPDPASMPELTSNERALLEDILGADAKELVTHQQAEQQMKEGTFDLALSTLLKLEQQKVERLWQKDTIGRIRTLCLRYIASETNREIIAGTFDGGIHAFNASGRRAWSILLNDHIMDVQTGFIDHHKQEEVVICSSDHHVYVLSGRKKQKRRDAYIDDIRMSSICVMAPNIQSAAEIIIGSGDKKLSIYGSDLKEPIETIPMPEGVKIVRAYPPTEGSMPEIVVASKGYRVYAYTRSGKRLWHYDTRDPIRAICIKDINGDGKVEVLVGSEDRNIHVLDSTGHLLWRYFLPHSALSVDAADIDREGRVEIIVGCADGYLYVFNREGDFQWKYQAHDRIHAVRVEDIDDNGNVEIVVGSEDELELLQVVHPRQVHALIDQCWSALCEHKSINQLISELLYNHDPYLQSFALGKFAEQDSFSADDFDILEQFTKESAVEVRKALVRAVITCFQVDPAKANQILHTLSVDADEDVRNTVVEHITTLMKYNWENGFLYLKRYSENDNRHVRRLVMRRIDQLIDTTVEITKGRQREIFDLLLAAAQYKDSEWVCQEAARTLAHFLDRYPGRLVVNIHLLIVNEIQPEILQHIAYAATQPNVKHYLKAVIPMLSGLNDENVLERTQQVVNALEEASGLVFSRDVRTIYAELCHLLTMRSIADIAQYQCPLSENQFAPDNEFAPIILEVFKKLNSISRALRIYLRREGLPDRLSSLLDTIAAIDKMNRDLEQPYGQSLMGKSITKLPDRQVFILLLQRWREMMLAQLNELRGKAELKAELKAKQTRYEDQVGIWLTVRNEGHSSASGVKITLLHGDNFSVVGKNSFETDLILPQEETTAEFILSPLTTKLDLRFEIAYGDAELDMKIDEFEDRLELSESLKEFRYIPNPYSTGTPTHDSKMFFGREADIAFLQDNLTRSAKTVIVLYGQRRSGKTTLLLQLINTCAFGEHIPVLIDMQRVSYNINIHNFLSKVAYAIAQAMKRSHLQVCEPKPGDFDADPTGTFDVFLDNVEEQLKERKLTLLVDEFEVLEEQVVKGKLEPEIFEYLRDILQHRQNLNFLFSGTHKITEYTKWYRSVFFNIARHYRLSRLSPQGAEALIQQPVAGYLEYEPLTVTKIRRLTSDQPYLIHLMCRAIVDYCNDRRKTYVTINDVNIVLREVMQTIHFHFDWLWDQISPEERVALSALAEGSKEEGRWLTLDEIVEMYQRNHIPFKREYLLASLRTLIDADIIEDKSSEYTTLDSSRFRIPVGLTQRWVLRDRPLELVRRELSD
jgi:outer membrane protein assembly factor BamB